MSKSYIRKVTIGDCTLYHGDCLEVMGSLDKASVDAVLTDPPYGTTACKWDTIIPVEEMWVALNSIVRNKNVVIAIFSNEPFTSLLISSNINGFKYRWDWDKVIPSGVSYSRHRPMQQTEDICIFTKNGDKTKYNPQRSLRDKPIRSGKITSSESANTKNFIPIKKLYKYKNPTTTISFMKIRNGSVHPTQKPVDLIEYLTKTYTNKNQTVLDFTMGSGTTGVACVNSNRKFIGIELDEDYFNISVKRIQEAYDNKKTNEQLKESRNDFY